MFKKVMYDADKRKIETYRKAKKLFYSHNADRIKENGIMLAQVPYNKKHILVMYCKAEGV